MKHSLKNEILRYINQQEGWVKKVDLYILADQLGYSPESAGRMVRELCLENKVKVDYYDGKFAKNLAKYCRLSHEVKKPKYVEIIRDGQPVMVLQD